MRVFLKKTKDSPESKEDVQTALPGDVYLFHSYDLEVTAYDLVVGRCGKILNVLELRKCDDGTFHIEFQELDWFVYGPNWTKL